jgi:hypothetical protein
MCLCTTLDGAQFEDPRGQDFEEFSEQQQFANEGKWSLIMFQPYLISQILFFTLYACMCLEFDGTQIKDMPSFNLSSLIKPGCFH